MCFLNVFYQVWADLVYWVGFGAAMAFTSHLFFCEISPNTDKLLMLPTGKPLSPYKFDSLKSYLEDILSPLCIGLKAPYPEKVISSFFSYSKVSADCDMSSSFASV